jgi:hypothetical protein
MAPVRRGIWAGVLLLGLGLSALDSSAASGPFEHFPGSWTGTGTIQLASGKKERIRCRATYRVRGSGAQSVDLQLGCESDSYNFQLTGDLEANESGQISGRWSENTRNIGGSVIGRARGDRLQVHVESTAFAADLVMNTRERQQSVTIDSQGGGETIKASMTLRRN